jgi:hypothetical protein
MRCHYVTMMAQTVVKFIAAFRYIGDGYALFWGNWQADIGERSLRVQ